MFFEIVKIFSKDIILIGNEFEQKILIATDIGFERKIKEPFDIKAVQDVKSIEFKKNQYADPVEVIKLDIEIRKIEKISKIIAEDAQIHFDINDDDLFTEIFNNMVFAVQNLKVSRPLQNPLIREIRIVCSNEFFIVSKGAKLILKDLDVKFLSGEIGLIANIIYDKREKTDIIPLQLYNNMISLIPNVTYTNDEYRDFIYAINSFVTDYQNNKTFDKRTGFSPLFIRNIRREISDYFIIAEKIIEMLIQDIDVRTIDKTILSILAIEIYKIANA